MAEVYLALVWACATTAQERHRARLPRPVGRHRLHPGRGPRLRRAGCGATCSASPTRAPTPPSTPRTMRPNSPRGPACNFRTVPIAPMVDAFQAIDRDRRARRGEPAGPDPRRHLDGASNQHGHLVLACGNKSELPSGYSDASTATPSVASRRSRTCRRRWVWELASWRNAEADERGEKPPIPENAITKAPQRRAAARPAGHRLAAAVRTARRHPRRLRRGRPGHAEIVAQGFDPAWWTG